MPTDPPAGPPPRRSRRPTTAAAPTGVDDLSLAERVCLTLVDSGIDHGWAIGTELSPGNELGNVWSLSRPLTYRAVEQLVAKDLVRRSAPRPGQGRERLVLSCSAAGRRLVEQWLDLPVDHLRDVRTELLLKLLLRRRRGLPLEPVLTAQRAAFGERIDALTAAGGDADLVELWRREHARAVRRFLDAAGELDAGARGASRRTLMPLSARNQLQARIVAIDHGDILSSVRSQLPDGQTVTAIVTRESVHDLDLAPDDEVLVIVKSTEVMLAALDAAGTTRTDLR